MLPGCHLSVVASAVGNEGVHQACAVEVAVGVISKSSCTGQVRKGSVLKIRRKK
jgi:hypothetical protein